MLRDRVSDADKYKEEYDGIRQQILVNVLLKANERTPK
jgi:hypothetical protein